MFELLWLLLTAVLAWACPRHDLVLENLLLRHQLALLTRPTRPRPRTRLHLWDKLVWVLARRLCAGWREHLRMVTPDTVVRWHRQGWRLFWRWKSRSRGGRPQLSPEVRELIMTMSPENRLWGTERIVIHHDDQALPRVLGRPPRCWLALATVVKGGTRPARRPP